MKKMICMFLALFMLIPMFSGCAQRNTENLYGDTENRTEKGVGFTDPFLK